MQKCTSIKIYTQPTMLAKWQRKEISVYAGLITTNILKNLASKQFIFHIQRFHYQKQSTRFWQYMGVQWVLGEFSFWYTVHYKTLGIWTKLEFLPSNNKQNKLESPKLGIRNDGTASNLVRKLPVVEILFRQSD